MSRRRTEEGMKIIQKLVIRGDTRTVAEKLSVDALLAVLLDLYQETKRKLLSEMRVQKTPTDLISLKEAETLLSQYSRWRELQPAVLAEMVNYAEAGESEKTFRVETLLTALVDLGVYREADEP